MHTAHPTADASIPETKAAWYKWKEWQAANKTCSFLLMFVDCTYSFAVREAAIFNAELVDGENV